MFPVVVNINPASAADYQILESWEQWFQKRGIRTVRRNLDSGMVELHRDGLPHRWPACKAPGCPCPHWVGPHNRP